MTLVITHTTQSSLAASPVVSGEHRLTVCQTEAIYSEYNRMPIKNCIFCNCLLRPSRQNQSDSQTAEHIFAEWFRKLSLHKLINMYVGNVNAEIPELRYRPTLTNLTMKGVCKKCNEGWMSTLEGAVDPIMTRLFDKTDVDQLSDSELAILAQWTAKTAITLSYTTPRHAPVPVQASHSLHPDYQGPVRFGFFYSKIKADRMLENGHLQLVYGTELGLVGTEEIAGTRLVLCLNNHLLIVDFPPVVPGFQFDLQESCSAQLWPTRKAAGVASLNFQEMTRVDQVLLAVCRAIRVQINTGELHV
jgi:hypothetical protein